MDKDIERLGKERLGRQKKHKKWILLTIMLSVIALSASVYNLIQPAHAEESSETADLRAYITSENKVNDISYDSASGTVTASLEVYFEIPRDNINLDNLTYYYELPEGTIVSDDLLNKTAQVAHDDTQTSLDVFTYKFEAITGDDGTPTGRYKVRIELNPTYSANAKEFIKGHFSFDLGFGKSNLGENGEYSVKLGVSDDTIVKIPYQDGTYFPDDNSNIKRDITTKKTSDGLVYINGETYLRYTVEISTKNGTEGEIAFADEMTYSGFSITEFSIDSVTVTDSAGNTTPETKYSTIPTIGTDKCNWNLTLDSLGAGESYTITYLYKVTNVSDTDTLTPSASNIVTTTVGTENEWDYIKDTGNVTVDKSQFKTNLVNKTGEYDENNNKIEWKITVNASNTNINGYTLEDDMFSRVPATDIDIQPADDLCSIANGKITFSAPTGTDINTNTYVISYTEDVSKETVYDGQTVTNTATIYNGETKLQDVTGSVPVKRGTITKTATAGNGDPENKSVEITWSTTYKTELSGIAKDMVYTDYLETHYGVKYEWFSCDQIRDIYDALKKQFGAGSFTLSVYELDSTTYDATNTAVTYIRDEPEQQEGSEETEVSDNLDETKLYYKFEVKFLKDIAQKEFTLTYKSMASIANESYAFYGNWYFKNDTAIGNHTASAKYTFAKFVIKSDGKYTDTTDTKNTEHEYEEDGTVSWVIRIAVTDAHLGDATTVTLSDAVDQNLDLTKIEFGTSTSSFETVYDAGTATNVEQDSVTASASYTSSSREITVNFSSKDKWETVKDKGFLYVKVTCKLKENSLTDDTQITVSNTAVVKYGETKTATSNTQSQTIKREEDNSGNTEQSTEDNKNSVEAKILTKTRYISSKEVNQGRLHYAIEINPDSEMLNGGGYLTLEDVLKYWGVVNTDKPYSLSLVAGSVELYEEDDNHELSVDGNGAIAKGNPVSNNAWSYEYKEEGKDQDNDYKYNTLSVKIPDGKHLYLLYAYDMDCSIKNADFTLNSNDFSNTATISGVATDTSDKQLTWQISSTKAGGSSGKVHTFRKVEAGKNNKTLAGAVFSLWVYDKENTSWKDTGITYTSSDSDLDFGTFSVSMSGGTGASESYDYQYNTAYYLVEEEAPEGYKTPETTTKYYFYFSGDENEYPLNMPDYFRDANGSYNPIDISTDSGTTDIKNEPILTIKKVWLGADDGEITPDESLVVTVEVYQNHGDDSTLYKTIELKKDNQWTAELDNLDQYDSENKLCTYSVKEISVKNADGTDLTSLYKDPKYTNNNVVPGNEITITNQLATQYTLPKTGGTGRNLLYMFGGLLTLGAGFLLIYRKHKII